MTKHIDGPENRWHYLGIDADPPLDGKMHVLTIGRQSVIGDRTTQGIIAWAPLMKRDKAKEKLQEHFYAIEGLDLAATELENRRQFGRDTGLDKEQMKQLDQQFLNSLGIEL